MNDPYTFTALAKQLHPVEEVIVTFNEKNNTKSYNGVLKWDNSRGFYVNDTRVPVNNVRSVNYESRTIEVRL